MAEIELEFDSGLTVGFGMKDLSVTRRRGCSATSGEFERLTTRD